MQWLTNVLPTTTTKKKKILQHYFKFIIKKFENSNNFGFCIPFGHEIAQIYLSPPKLYFSVHWLHLIFNIYCFSIVWCFLPLSWFLLLLLCIFIAV